MVAQLLTDRVRRSRLLCLTNPLQQGVFFCLKRCVAVLQRHAIFGRLLLGDNRLVLCCCFLSLTLGRLLLLPLICCIICSLLTGVCGRLLWVIPEAGLNIFR